MTGRRRKARTTIAGRLVRGRRLDRNPLRRGFDRAETLVLLLLTAAFLAGAPLVAAAGGAWAHAMANQAETAQQAARYRVAAVVRGTPVPAAPGSRNLTSQARWTAPDGTVATKPLPVPAGTVVGAVIRVWVTRDGQLTPQPMNDNQVSSLTYLGKVTGVISVAVLLAVIGALARWSLDRRRFAAWEADWKATAPRWTSRR
jgi:hypothetical protein